MRREPAFYVGLFEAVLAVLLSFGLFGLTGEKVSLIMAVVVAGLGFYTAWATRDTLLGVGVGLSKAVLALGIGYGLMLTDAQTGALIAVVTVALGAFNRTQTSPLAVGSFKAVAAP
jgi:hypothetical protein